MIENNPLRESLDALRAEIAALSPTDGPVNEQAHQRLERLLQDLEQKLDSPTDQELHKSLVDQLDDSIMHFEVAHPTLTKVMNRMMVTLSDMGI